ncbi:beta-N-acetylhexosaminidase [Neobacillus muris]|uniref:beta-N-acetylhexosaminidase n=1 Tax=Neobacillus muris TaxID=2941334 RepID=UPI0020406237|nr:beta-N-acetylhexosaminidase [Neobacillus muris]
MRTSSRKRKSIKKRVLYSVLFLAIVLCTAIYVFGGDGKGTQSGKEKTVTTPSNKKPSDEQTTTNQSAVVKQVFSLSKEGKVLNCPFISGNTTSQTVENAWGTPTQSTQTAAGLFNEYTNHHVTAGYQGETLNDLRSNDPEIQSIDYHEIKKVSGEPDEVRYYKDQTHDQIILVYHVTSSYQLKWILPKPNDQNPNPKVDHISVYTQVENQDPAKTISEMSLDEKIGQMVLAGISGTTVDADTKKLITSYKVGGMILYSENLVNPQQTVQLLNQLKSDNVSNPLPLLLSTDQEGGSITRLPGGLTNFPTNQEIGGLHNPEFSYKIGTLLGRELKEFGFNLDFAPVMDINSNPQNPIIGDRSFGDNADIVSRLGIQTMKGIQSQNIIPTIKHFPGHGDTSVDSHLELPIVYKSMTELKKLELIPFERAIDNGADVVMAAHILLPKLDADYPASMSKTIITNILRNQLHFNGVVITDDMTMKAITNHYDIGKAAVDSVKAGADIILVAHDYNKIIETISSIKTAVQNGDISEQRINESVTRIIKLKKKYALDNSTAGNVDISQLNQAIEEAMGTVLPEP